MNTLRHTSSTDRTNLARPKKPVALTVAFWTVLSLAALVLPACFQANLPTSTTTIGTTEEAIPMPTTNPLTNEKLYAAVATGQIIVDGDTMRIGVGNLETDDAYMDAGGAPHRGNTAGLWFFFRDQPDLDQHMRVYEDQVIEILGHTIRVVSIDLESGQVVLGIARSETPATATPSN